MIKEINFAIKLNDLNKVLNQATDEQLKPINLKFDFDNDRLTINDKKTLKVENDWNYVYKFMKTKIKAADGIDGLYKNIKKASNPEDFWNNRLYSVLMKATL